MIKKGFLILIVLSVMLSCVPACAEEITLEKTSASGVSFDLYLSCTRIPMCRTKSPASGDIPIS